MLPRRWASQLRLKSEPARNWYCINQSLVAYLHLTTRWLSDRESVCMPRRLPQPPPEAEVSLSQARRTFPPRPRWFLRYLPRASWPPGGHCCCQLLGWSCQLRSAEASTSSGTLLVLVMDTAELLGASMVAAPSLGTCWYSLYLLLAAPAPCSSCVDTCWRSGSDTCLDKWLLSITTHFQVHFLNLAIFVEADLCNVNRCTT